MSDDDIMKVFISHKSQNQISEDFQNLQNCGCILVIVNKNKNKFNIEHQNFIYAMAEKSNGILQDLHSL